MFFSEELLTSKKGSFGIIWLAATLGPRTKKITRKQLIGVDLSKTCELIAEPPEPLALRVSGCLLVGVARVYNQNYEIFYADVSTFHENLRKTLLHDPNRISGGPGVTFSLDLPGDGKSRNDVITFSDKLDLDLPWSLDFSAMHFNWKDPFGSNRKRRSSSQLESLQTQQSQHEENEEAAEEDEDAEDVEVGRREKKRRVDSSPGLIDSRLRPGKKTAEVTPGTGMGQRSSPFEVAPLEPVDLELWEEGDISISDPSRPVPEILDEAMPPHMDTDEFQLDLPVVDELVDQVPHTPTAEEGVNQPKSILKKRKTTNDGEEADLEGETNGGTIKKRTKKGKAVSFDDDLEMNEAYFEDFRINYSQKMHDLRDPANQRESGKRDEETARAMVDGGGGWLEFLDPDMNAAFASMSKVEAFKWERDGAAQKSGEDHSSKAKDNDRALIHDDPFAIIDHGDGQFPSYVEEMVDYTIPVNDESRPRRESEVDEVEQMRRMSHISSQALPWETRRVDSSPGNPDYLDFPDDSFSPGSLKLSGMTPQERRIRLNSRNNSSHGFTGSQARSRAPRSRSGSILEQRAVGDPQMLVEDDLELPLIEAELGITESQAAEKIAQLPEAFQPGMLATLEDQCRTFLSYVEKTMVRQKTDEIQFADLLPKTPTPSKRVAALAFYNCLTIATKHMIVVDQPEPWHDISIRFAVDL